MRFEPLSAQAFLSSRPKAGPATLAAATGRDAAAKGSPCSLTPTRARHLGRIRGERYSGPFRAGGAEPRTGGSTRRRQRAIDQLPPFGAATAAPSILDLLKARLLPAALVLPSDGRGKRSVSEASVQRFRIRRRMLTRVAEAEVAARCGRHPHRCLPPFGWWTSTLPSSSANRPKKPVLARLHSECFTGDLCSLRCDCGDQLRGAIEVMSREGAAAALSGTGGRGIGLRTSCAPTIQDRGADTLDANEQLGFDADERVYARGRNAAARLLRVRLLTNNPEGGGARRLRRRVCTRAPQLPANGHNEAYLDTKARRFGHLL